MAMVDHELCFALEKVDPSHLNGAVSSEFLYFCALSLPEKQYWFESIKKILEVPKLPKNDFSKFEVSTLHKFSMNSSGAFPEVVASIALESIDAVLLGTKDTLMGWDPTNFKKIYLIQNFSEGLRFVFTCIS